jgi:hypothetical protein
MPEFELPVATHDLLNRVLFLSVSFDADIEADRGDRIEDILGNERAKHAEYRRTVTFGTERAELSAVLGVHSEEQTQGPNDFYVHGHVRVERRPPRDELTCPEETWAEFRELLKDLMADSPAAVNLRMALPAEGTVTAVTLPIGFGPGDVAGFSEIRGVQLVQSDPDDENKWLYSVIMQRTAVGVFIDVETPAALDLNSGVLSEAFVKIMDVAKLAVPSMESR